MGLFFSITRLSAQSVIKEYPLFYIDSVRIESVDFRSLNPNSIAEMTAYKNEEAKKMFGEQARNGVIFIETKVFKKKKFWEMLCKKSEDYCKLVPNPDADSTIRYIYPGKTILERADAKIFNLKPEEISKVKIIGFKEMERKYKVKGVRGVVVRGRKINKT